jgi:hypothetical protein
MVSESSPEYRSGIISININFQETAFEVEGSADLGQNTPCNVNVGKCAEIVQHSTENQRSALSHSAKKWRYT